MIRKKRYWKEMASFISGEMDHERADSFLIKASKDQQLNKEYQLMKKTWDHFSSNPADRYRDTGKAWTLLNRRIENEELNQQQMPVTRRISTGNFLRLAAVALLILAIGIPVLYYSLTGPGGEEGLYKYNSPEGTLTVSLPDGSRVFLNKGAQLQYNDAVEQQREVTLKGEGYFDVAADQDRPFLVNAGKVTLTVLGTSFNVREEENSSVEIFVESGSVKVDLKDVNQTTTLGAGQLCKANGSFMISTMEDLNYLAWKTRDFKFVDESIEEILRVLEKAYHVDVRTENITEAGMRLTTSYSNQSFDSILSTICTALNITYEKEGKVYILQPN
jgi:transmembrane sensor